MIARLHILLPFIIVAPENEQFPIYSGEKDGYKVHFFPPVRNSEKMFGDRPQWLKISGRPAVEVNVLRIDFQKSEFNRQEGGPFDPPQAFIRLALNQFQTRLRYIAQAPHALEIPFPQGQWRLEYRNDDDSELEAKKGFVRGHGTAQFHFSFIALPVDTWNRLHRLPTSFVMPVWNELRLDAVNALPNIGTSVVLAAASLEVFIGMLLDRLASAKGVSGTLWEWIRDRKNHRDLQPTVEEQFDSLLKEMTGYSLKDERLLWDAFMNLKSARNSFVHEGIARIGQTPLSVEDARKLVGNTADIIEKIRGWVPEKIRWDAPLPGVEVEFAFILGGPAPQTGLLPDAEPPKDVD